MSGVAKDITGNIYGRLVVIRRAENRNNKPYWECRCLCGNTKIIRPDGLKNGLVVSCGCYRNEISAKRIRKSGKSNPGFKHGHSFATKRSPTYYSWDSMISRCTRPSNCNWEYYGGRGITVCDRWQGEEGFTNFLKDVGIRPKGKTIDRVDNNKGYFPENVKWSTQSEQNYNQRRSL